MWGHNKPVARSPHVLIINKTTQESGGRNERRIQPLLHSSLSPATLSLPMAISSLLPTTPKHQPHHHLSHEAHDPPSSKNNNNNKHHHLNKKKQQQKPPDEPLTSKSKPPSSWEQLKSLLSCRSLAPSQVHDPSTIPQAPKQHPSLKLATSCSDLCSFRDVTHDNAGVVRRRPDHDYGARLLPTATNSTRATQHHHGSSRGMQLRKLSGCYECRSIYEPTRQPMPRTICRCPECGEVFTRTESLEIHQTIRHAVSELGPEDSSRNIVEIIFKSSWIKKDVQLLHPPFLFKIERILKVHNTQRTISRFEDYRDAVRSRAALLLLHHNTTTSNNNKANKKNPRCAADGNELLRFHCTTLTCSLGARGSTSLCGVQGCRVCAILRHGFGKAARQEQGSRWVRTTASSGRAHECCTVEGARRRAMLVCRVIAGRVRTRGAEEEQEEEDSNGYDSVYVVPGNRGGGGGGGRGDSGGTLEELFVANPRAILPCFVVVYRTLDGI